MRTIVEAARAMIYAKDLSTKLWAEAVNTAVYLLNRTGPSPVPGKTPYELWYNKKADLGDFRIFGSQAYAHVPKEKRRKWDQKALKGNFVGYEENTKGYRIWIPSQNMVEISRDVKAVSEGDSKVTIRLGHEAGSQTCTSKESNTDSGTPADISVSDNIAGDSSDGFFQDQEFESAEKFLAEEATTSNQTDSHIPIKQRLRNATKSVSSMASILEGHVFVMQQEPRGYEDAVKSENSSKWKKAMDEEMDSLCKNGTWDVVVLPKGRKVIDSRWVYKIKPAN